MVNVEESLFQEKADTDRIIMLESEKLIEFTASRKPPANAETSVLEFLRKTQRQLVEFHASEALSDRQDLD